MWFTYYYSRNVISVNYLKTYLKIADEPEISASLTFKDWNAGKQLHNFFMVLVVKNFPSLSHHCRLIHLWDVHV